MEQRPSRMLDVLRDCGALARILPELDAPKAALIDAAAEQGVDLPVRFAVLMRDLEPAVITDVSKRLRVPTECRDLAVMAAREQGKVAQARDLRPEDIVSLFERCDGFRKPERFAQMLLACEVAAGGEGQAPHLLRALDAARAVNAGEVAARCADQRGRISAAVHAARVAAVAGVVG
jgi:tRNA nucleotidyltransferase (CCA-adding enzyme)